MGQSTKASPPLIFSLLMILLAAGACSARNAVISPEPPTPFLPDSPTASPLPENLPQTQIHTSTPEPSPVPQKAAEIPDPAGYAWRELVTGLNRPVGLTSAGDGSGRLFLIEQPGRILVYQGDRLLETPFLDIQDRVGSSQSEQGLLGLAFPPDYAATGIFFVNYTAKDGSTIVSRFSVSPDPDRADSTSEDVLLTIAQPYQNHNGGQISFGPEGYLWIATGDGGGAGDPQGNAQNLDNLLGKLLRIDIDQLPYAIPGDNPFGNEIWSYGLRNPWRFTFDPANGDLFIADVGQKLWEEINYLPAGSPAGANFGWDYREGRHPYEGTPPADLQFIDPVFEYDHSQGCSISGGAVYRGSLPEWQGVYLYGDFCTGMVWGLLQDADGAWQNAQLFSTDRRIAALDQDESGEVYLVDIQGAILRLVRQ